MAQATDKTIHMIGHGHIDPTWLWRWTEGYEEVRATFRSALDRLDETPDLYFTASSACFYHWIEQSEPKIFEKIKARIAEGRWEIAGGMWIEPDCNLPCGESFVRQGLHAQRYFQKTFGQRATVGFNPDSFGHAGNLPQILSKLGMQRYAFMRPMPVIERDYPDGTTFFWEAPDGSRVLTCNLLVSYNADADTTERIEELASSPHLNKGQRQVLGFFGVGNHGGGPTKAAIEAVQRADESSKFPAAKFSTLEGYFDAFEKESPADQTPVVADELQHHARGCYSVHAPIKRLNRETEHALMTAERFATAAWLLEAHDYPHALFDSAWRDLLYNQFHDILAGSSIESSYEDARDQLGAARHRAHVVINEAAQTIARDIDTTPEGNTVVVFNPLTWPVREPVSVSPIVERTLDAPLHLVNEDEHPVPMQAVRGERAAGNRYVFHADVPAMGFRCYHVRSGEQIIRAAHTLEHGRDWMENAWWRLELDPYSGHIARLFDKRNNCEVLHAGAWLAAFVDHSDTWSHGVTAYRTEAGRFGGAAISCPESGSVLTTLRAETRLRDSTASVEYTLYPDSDTIDVSVSVNWQEAHHVLKLGFDTGINVDAVTAESAYGHALRKPDGEEQPAQQWVDIAGALDDKRYGLAVLNDGTFAYDASDGSLRLTLLRSPAYAHHDPDRYVPSRDPGIMDLGRHQWRFRLVPHAGPWQDARIIKQAWELNAPPLAHVESAHPGKRPRRATLMGTEADNVLLSVVKQSEDGGELIVRGYETAGRDAKTTLHLPFFDQTFELSFSPHELKTVRINTDNWSMREVDLLEE